MAVYGHKQAMETNQKLVYSFAQKEQQPWIKIKWK